MRIDAHQHFWNLENPFTNWPTEELKAIYRNFLPVDIEEHLKKHNIDKTILVQAAPNVEETEFLLGLADQYEKIAGVVGWLDLASEDFREQIDQYRKHPKFVGVRPMLQGLPDDRWILRPEVKRNIQILVEYDFPIDILIYSRHIPYIVELLKEFPTLRAVIDHCAKPNIKNREWDPWAEGMSELATFNSVYCKVSGLITEADHEAWQVEDFQPYIQHVFESFGASRVMFGSDWPVCNLAGSYDDVIEVINKNVPANLTEEELDKLFGENARRFYQL